MARVNSIEVNDLKIDFVNESDGSKLCDQCSWQSICHHELIIDHLSIKTIAGKISIKVEINECSYYLPQPPEKELTQLMEDTRICKR